jgi:hypothetical protein
MKLSMAVRAVTIGCTVALMMIAVGSTTSYSQRAKTKRVVATAPQYVHEQPVKLRYYGGPKSPMYP